MFLTTLRKTLSMKECLYILIYVELSYLKSHLMLAWINKCKLTKKNLKEMHPRCSLDSRNNRDKLGGLIASNLLKFMISVIQQLSLWRTEKICQIMAIIILDYSCRTVLLLDSLVASLTFLKARWGWKLTVQYPHGYMFLNIAGLCFQVCL